MLGQLVALMNIAEKLSSSSPPIDYYYVPPKPQLVPDIALKTAPQNKSFWTSMVCLHNLSSKVLPSIRIKIPIRTILDPVITLSRTTDVGAKYEPQVQEVKIPQLDPGEEVLVTIFLYHKEVQNFTEPKIIIDGRTLSRSMMRAGLLKKFPKLALSLIFARAMVIIAALSVIALIAYIGYSVFSPVDPKDEALRNAASSFEKVGCRLRAYEKALVDESLLAKHRLGEGALLKLNQVVIREDLYDKDYVVICEATGD